MVAAAGSVVALIDASKFGKVCLAPFARVDQIAHIFTDSSLSSGWIEQLRRTCVKLTVCDESTISTFAPCDREAAPYKIGFANLTERMPFAVQVRLGLEQAAAAQKNVDLLIRDNDLDRQRALENVDWFIAQGRPGDRVSDRCGSRQHHHGALPPGRNSGHRGGHSPAGRDLLRRG